MIKLAGLTLVLAAVGGSLCCAQVSDNCQPSSLNIPEAKCPCVYPDHRAPEAREGPHPQRLCAASVQTKLVKFATNYTL